MWRPLNGLAQALRVLLILSAVISVALAGTALSMRGALEDAADSTNFGVRDDAVTAVNNFFSALSFQFLAIIPIGIVFIIWMWRLAKNNEALGRGGPSFGPGWAIGGWFVPIGSLVIPALHLQELWKGTDPSIPRGDPSWKRAPMLPLLWLWWVTYTVGQLLLFFGTRGIGETGSNANAELTVEDLISDLDSVRTGINLVVAGALLLVAGAVACITVVFRVSRRQATTVSTLGLAPMSAYAGAWSAAPPGSAGAPPAAAVSPPAWHPDPTGRYDHRYWDGQEWTDHVSRQGVQLTDPV